MAYALKMGDKLIRDIENPRPDEIDLDHIERVLWGLHRWSGNPDALTVRQHTHFTGKLAEMCGEPEGVVRWCKHHDDHEAVIGDIAGPLKALIGARTNVLSRVERKLDEAICAARGIPMPTDGEALRVHHYDKMSEAIEWQYLFGHPVEPWNAAIPDRWSGAFLSTAVFRAKALTRDTAMGFYLIEPC